MYVVDTKKQEKHLIINTRCGDNASKAKKYQWTYGTQRCPETPEEHKQELQDTLYEWQTNVYWQTYQTETTYTVILTNLNCATCENLLFSHYNKKMEDPMSVSKSVDICHAVQHTIQVSKYPWRYFGYDK